MTKEINTTFNKMAVKANDLFVLWVKTNHDGKINNHD